MVYRGEYSVFLVDAVLNVKRKRKVKIDGLLFQPGYQDDSPGEKKEKTTKDRTKNVQVTSKDRTKNVEVTTKVFKGKKKTFFVG